MIAKCKGVVVLKDRIMKTKYKHIYFERDIAEEKELERKTQIWIIWNNDKISVLLGRVEWYSPWRQYVSNTDDIRLSRSCHLDIADFIKQLMEKRKNDRAN